MSFKQFLIPSLLLLLSSCVERGVVKDSVVRVKCEEAQSVCGVGESSSYPGKVQAMADVNLSFRVAGVIDRIVVREGAYVRSGETVALMDDRDYKLQYEATQAEYNSIKGEVERIIALYEDESVSQNDYEKAVNGLKQITSKLSAHRNAYEDTNLKAPFDGYVQSVNFDKGEAVSAGMPIMKFVSASAPEVVVNIPVIEYLKRADLTSVTATLVSFPDRVFTLERIGISHKANLNQLYETRFRVVSEDGVYPALGTSAMVSFNYEVEDDMKTSIPFAAIFERGGQDYVWRVVDGRSQLTKVKVVKINRDGRVVVDGGISQGDIIIIAGLNTIKDGERVEPLSKSTESNVGNIL